jgi:hypothetical protein
MPHDLVHKGIGYCLCALYCDFYLLILCGAGDQTQDLEHAMQELCAQEVFVEAELRDCCISILWNFGIFGKHSGKIMEPLSSFSYLAYSRHIWGPCPFGS